MKKFLVLLAACLPVMMAIGCSEEEIVRVGTPFNDEGTTGAEFNTGFTDSETIYELRKIVEMEEKIAPPKELAPVADLVLTLDKPEENVSERWRYVWYMDDGSAVLSNRANAVEEEQEFYALNEEQTKELKSILE
ncbi:hypothetical protein KQ939_00050 [Planococcus sp. CP5-4]|uniref:hypothetical protein n=1 Tax=unclassified Planococcus (in: firmicutes) TaxID=2662419 RepID=UPI001C21560E|nr:MULTISPECIES: hypothetical protein [unclassified Planococcus (in: firmicutes)]MBU9675185.1 hypothetical protein [Planococcus sp. CP5-4_YE]MBV0910697.1 hypothetical protein [Planococcus sp. CP5-4_UN]MBW6062092.1 hypothetical protein [Planococcus sp. CP5-4]